MENQGPSSVRIVDVDIPFHSLVLLIVGAALAVIPAGIRLAAVWLAALLLLRTVR